MSRILDCTNTDLCMFVLQLSKDAEPSRKPDAYDMAVRELIFDMKASVSVAL